VSDDAVVLVCGEALIDVLENGDGTQHRAAGGGPFNTARALARLRVPTSFLGRISTDSAGRELARILGSEGVNLDLTSTGPEPTTTAIARVDGDGVAEYEFLVDGTSAPNLTMAMVPDELPQGIKALHVGTLGLALEPMASTLAALIIRESGRLPIMLDPNIRLAAVSDGAYRERLQSLIPHVAIVKASVDDMSWLYPDLDYKAAARRILAMGVPLVVVTLGSDGAFGATDEGSVAVAAPAVDIVDTVGAGDTFGAALLARFYELDLFGLGRPDLNVGVDQLAPALKFACLAASITCTRAGADSPYRTELPRD
jgi:fructokinase